MSLRAAEAYRERLPGRQVTPYPQKAGLIVLVLNLYLAVSNELNKGPDSDRAKSNLLGSPGYSNIELLTERSKEGW